MARFGEGRNDSNIVKCSAVGCLNQLDDSSRISFFKFPSDRTRYIPPVCSRARSAAKRICPVRRLSVQARLPDTGLAAAVVLGVLLSQQGCARDLPKRRARYPK